AELNDAAQGLGVGRRNVEGRDRRTEIDERLPNALRVGGLDRHPDVEVTGGTRKAVGGESVGADHQKTHLPIAKRLQQVEKVPVHDLAGRPITWIGISWRA